ncbi:unnamed protein product [Plutella xylostella]|uniref:(diamondback moth) hypothetical protein n=1 Tax=Plutella xylostella TaxID=51655 RepID=A0A8S4FUY3_PLUXY|nr:unnamed protein product [Plutella xylostella]
MASKHKCFIPGCDQNEKLSTRKRPLSDINNFATDNTAPSTSEALLISTEPAVTASTSTAVPKKRYSARNEKVPIATRNYLEKKIQTLRCKKDSYVTRLKKAMKLSENETFKNFLNKFTSLAAIFTIMQFREISKPKMGRRFSRNEKIMALNKGILPIECKDTADILLFFDELFDSLNGSYDNSKKRCGKILLKAVTPKSEHSKSGFRTGHSTVTALIKVTDDIRLNMENHRVTVLTLLDFSNAFNTVDLDILLGILRSLNVSPTVTTWFESYLKGRQQCVRTDAESSAWCPVLAGVPQGGVLSPLLFSLFINILAKQLTSLYHLYADDLQIYTSALPEDINSAIDVINQNLDIISKWVKKFGLLLNPNKSQAIMIGSPRLLNRSYLSLDSKLYYDGPISKLIVIQSSRINLRLTIYQLDGVT